MAANIPTIIEEEHRTSNDTARLHLVESVRSVSTTARYQTTKVYEHHGSQQINLAQSSNYKYFTSPGWVLRKRKHNNSMTKKVKDYIEKRWLESQHNKSKVSAEIIQSEIRTVRSNTGIKLFDTQEYPTLNQVKYQYRKLMKKYEVYTQEQLIEEMVEHQILSQTNST